MSFDILNKLFPDSIPDVSDFFSHDPQHKFTVSTVIGLTGLSNYHKAYEKFVAEHWLPTREAIGKVLEDTKVVIDDVKVVVAEVGEAIDDLTDKSDEVKEVVTETKAAEVAVAAKK